MERGVEWMVASVTWIRGPIRDFDVTFVMQGKAGYSSILALGRGMVA
jgi:hypothetical protein